MTKFSLRLLFLTTAVGLTPGSAYAQVPEWAARFAKGFAPHVEEHVKFEGGKKMTEVLKCWLNLQTCAKKVDPAAVEQFRRSSPSKQEEIRKAISALAAAETPPFAPDRVLTAPPSGSSPSSQP